MIIRDRRFLWIFFLGLPIFLGIGWADVGPTYAIWNTKIVPVWGPAVEKGVLIIRDGLIDLSTRSTELFEKFKKKG
jgi:hypothetical protein